MSRWQPLQKESTLLLTNYGIIFYVTFLILEIL